MLYKRKNIFPLIFIVLLFLFLIQESLFSDQEFYILMRARHRVKQAKYRIEEIYKSPEVQPGSTPSGTTDATDGSGLNLLLIDELEQGYLKDLLTCYKNSEYGKYDSYAIKLPVAASCGLHSVENGPYRNGFLDSYLPYTDHIIWNENYKGEAASNLTLEKFDKTVASRVGYYNKVDDPANNAVTVFQYTNNWSRRGVISKINGAGNSGRTSADHYFFPDVLAANNRYITEFIQNFLCIADAKQEDFSTELIAAFYGIAHNRGEAGAIRSMFGFYYGRMNCPYNIQKLNKAEMLEISNSYISYYTDYKKKYKNMSYAALPMDAQRYTYYVAVLALNSDDWFITNGYANMMKNHMSFMLEAWNGFYPNDKKNSDELLSIINSKVIDLPTAIKKVTGKTVSAAECMNVYGTSSGGYTKNDSGAYLFKVTNIRSDAYSNKYSDGSSPFVVHSLGYIPAREALAAAMGDIVYAKQLVLAGLSKVDPTSPTSYYNQFNKGSFRPSMQNTWLSQYSVNTDDLTPETISFLNKAYNLTRLENCVYPDSTDVNKMTEEFKKGVQPTVLDCSAFVCRALRDSGLNLDRIYTTREMIDGVDFLDVIQASEMQAGDLLCYNDGQQGHVMIYLCGNKDNSNIVVLESSSYKGSNNRTGPSVRAIINCKIASTNNITLGTEYFVFRPKYK